MKKLFYFALIALVSMMSYNFLSCGVESMNFSKVPQDQDTIEIVYIELHDTVYVDGDTTYTYVCDTIYVDINEEREYWNMMDKKFLWGDKSFSTVNF